MTKNNIIYKFSNRVFRHLHSITNLQMMAFIFWSAEFAYISKIVMGEVYIFATLGLALVATIVCKYIIKFLNQ